MEFIGPEVEITQICLAGPNCRTPNCEYFHTINDILSEVDAGILTSYAQNTDFDDYLDAIGDSPGHYKFLKLMFSCLQNSYDFDKDTFNNDLFLRENIHANLMDFTPENITKILNGCATFLTKFFDVLQNVNLANCTHVRLVGNSNLYSNPNQNQEITLYHGHKTTTFDSINAPDTEITLPTFTSTSLSLSVACRFTGQYNVILCIKVPFSLRSQISSLYFHRPSEQETCTKPVFFNRTINPRAVDVDLTDEPFRTEFEILLPPGSMFKVLDVFNRNFTYMEPSESSEGKKATLQNAKVVVVKFLGYEKSQEKSMAEIKFHNNRDAIETAMNFLTKDCDKDPGIFERTTKGLQEDLILELSSLSRRASGGYRKMKKRKRKRKSTLKRRKRHSTKRKKRNQIKKRTKKRHSK